MVRRNAVKSAGQAFVVLCLAASVRAAVNFDQGVDASAALETIRARVQDDSGVAPAFHGRRYTMDCADLVFKPDSPPVSQAVTLRSTEWIDRCEGGHHPFPGQDPWDRGRGRHCVRYPGQTFQEVAQVTLRERKPLLPWESDTFRVCLEGPWLRADAIATGYEYSRGMGGVGRGDIVFIPGKKIPMRPDPAGLSTAALSPSLVLKIADKWASYYAGERTVLWLWLVQEWGPLRPTILDIKVYLPTSAVHELDLMKYSDSFVPGGVKPGGRYFVKYSFSREGSVSKPDWAPSWGYLGAIGTETIVYQPGSARP